jgi:hypothetical protein
LVRRDFQFFSDFFCVRAPRILIEFKMIDPEAALYGTTDASDVSDGFRGIVLD